MKIYRITADTAGDVLRSLHEAAGMARREFARKLAEATHRSEYSCNEQMYEWCRPSTRNGRYPNITTYEKALRHLGYQLAVVPIETPDKGHYGAAGHAFRSFAGADLCVAHVGPGDTGKMCGLPPAEHHSADYVAPARSVPNDAPSWIHQSTAGDVEWRHDCGHVEKMPASWRPNDGGCDACESGSSNPGDWRRVPDKSNHQEENA